MVTFRLTRSQAAPALVGIVAILALVLTACGGPDGTAEASATTEATSDTVTASTQAAVESSVPRVAGEGSTTSDAPAETEPTASTATTTDDPSRGDEGGDDTDAPLAYDDVATATAGVVTSADVDDVSPLPNEAVDAYLGGTPDVFAATLITRGLEEAGIDLTGITISVLPITGLEASLLVMEVGDEYVASGLPSESDGSDITGALLGLPQIESAAIAELVTVYRGVDEDGPFAMTFAVSMDDLRDTYAVGSDLGEALLVQVDRGS